MTYRAIRKAIKAVEGRLLFCLPPMLRGQEALRTVFVSREVKGIVWGPWTNQRDDRRHARLRALLDSFTTGAEITVAQNPFDKDATAILARVDPIRAEVWDFRCLDPHPGIRALGRFSEPDTFIALTWDYRENMSPDDWHREVSRCTDTWQSILGYNTPYEGKAANDYVTLGSRAV